MQQPPLTHETPGSVSKVEMPAPIPLICKALFLSISTFETPPPGQPTGISDGARPLVQLHPVSAACPACGAVRGGSGRRTRTVTRLVPQSPNPHVRRLSLSGHTPYH